MRIKENKWANLIKPSYNIQSIHSFLGKNHYTYGKTWSKETREKISKTLTGLAKSDLVRKNHILGSKKRKVYCYDYYTKKLVCEYESIRMITKELNFGLNLSIYRKLDKNLAFHYKYKGENATWLLKSVIS